MAGKFSFTERKQMHQQIVDVLFLRQRRFLEGIIMATVWLTSQFVLEIHLLDISQTWHATWGIYNNQQIANLYKFSIVSVSIMGFWQSSYTKTNPPTYRDVMCIHRRSWMAKPVAITLGRPIAIPSWPTSCLPRPHLLVMDSPKREPIEGRGNHWKF